MYGYNGQETTQYAVPADKAGLVIGKGGESIKEICRVSGAHVEISKEPSPDPTIKIFNVRGNRQEIDQAMRMISERASIFGRPTAVGSACGPWGQSGYSQSDSGGLNNTNGGNSASGMSALAFNPYAGQPDYSAAWAEYYRRQGMHDYADSIARQGQQQQAAQVTSIAMMPQQHGVAPSMISVQGQPATHEQYEYNQQWQQWQQRQAWQQQQGGNPNQSTGVYASSQQMQAASAPGYPSMPQ